MIGDNSCFPFLPFKAVIRVSDYREFLCAIYEFEGANMRTKVATTFRPHKLLFGLALTLALTPFAFGQTTQTMQPAANRPIQSIPNGAKLKFKGVVIAREGDTFRIRDRNRTDYLVLITDRT